MATPRELQVQRALAGGDHFADHFADTDVDEDNARSRQVETVTGRCGSTTFSVRGGKAVCVKCDAKYETMPNACPAEVV